MKSKIRVPQFEGCEMVGEQECLFGEYYSLCIQFTLNGEKIQTELFRKDSIKEIKEITEKRSKEGLVRDYTGIVIDGDDVDLIIMHWDSHDLIPVNIHVPLKPVNESCFEGNPKYEKRYRH